MPRLPAVTVEEFTIAQQVATALLDELLDDADLCAMWWQSFEDSYHAHLERYGAEPVTSWNWEVHCDERSYEDEDTGEVYTWDGYMILGTCRAIRR